MHKVRVKIKQVEEEQILMAFTKGGFEVCYGREKVYNRDMFLSNLCLYDQLSAVHVKLVNHCATRRFFKPYTLSLTMGQAAVILTQRGELELKTVYGGVLFNNILEQIDKQL